MVLGLLLLAQIATGVPMPISDVVAAGESLNGKEVLVTGRLYLGCTYGSFSCFLGDDDGVAKLSIPVTDLEPQINANRGKWIIMRARVDRRCNSRRDGYYLVCFDRAGELTPLELIKVIK